MSTHYSTQPSNTYVDDRNNYYHSTRLTADNASEYKSDSDDRSIKDGDANDPEKSSAPSPHIARGPSESYGSRAEEKFQEIRRVQSQQEEDGEIVYPSKLKLAGITIALCLAVFCMALDNLIIATAIPVSFTSIVGMTT